MEDIDDLLKRFELTTEAILKQHELMLAMLKIVEFNTRPKDD